jgi:uncharacterized membrane protein
MLVTLTHGSKFCTSLDGVCNAAAAEVFCVLNAGEGYIAIHSGKDAFNGESAIDLSPQSWKLLEPSYS